MKHKIILLATVLALFASCEKDAQNDTALEQQLVEPKVINVQERSAVNALVSLLGDKPEYFDYVNGLITSSEMPYMEDRVLFGDLLKPQNVHSLSTASPADFASDFALHINGASNLSKSASDANTENEASELMVYLTENNISIYCPFPLDDYAEDNRIPAICSIVSDNLDSLPGVQYYADGTYEEVVVSQAYADEHPVWIVRKEGDYIFDTENAREDVQKKSVVSQNIAPIGKEAHYEASIASLYCLNYYGGIGEGELQLHIGTVSKTPVNISSSLSPFYCGEFDQFEVHYVPRKYVGWAKKGYAKGWFIINQIIDDDWNENKAQHYVLLYEYDRKKEKNVKHTFETQFKYKGASAGYKTEISYTITDGSDMIGVRRWSRDWFIETAKKGDGETVWQNENGVGINKYDNRLYSTRMGEVMMSIKSRTYFTDKDDDSPTINPPIKPIDPNFPGGVDHETKLP